MKIRSFEEKDRNNVKALTRRFLQFDLMKHRDRTVMEQKQEALLLESLQRDDLSLFIAENDHHFLGYLEMRLQNDFFTNERQGYITAIATTPEAEGKGVGKRLMQKAEEWAQEQGVHTIVLDVFKANEHAVAFYEKFGYQQEIVKMTKPLDH
ncbi:GNAT family N-acetyltransferase [Shouchella miscanthi]|uniref:GNAT family N-acetyltransferase n=1 Tax=Shouchella miscanthi TaxID=2598861 RepID=A0ABU6NEX2_9BACI|nr:GNAT family N-acetyltransferase [Shouchella miscanthi]MED4126556.1 GNAT family N-acetyltransferase [Shouchella miscanthi]